MNKEQKMVSPFSHGNKIGLFCLLVIVDIIFDSFTNFYDMDKNFLDPMSINQVNQSIYAVVGIVLTSL